jgi:hypothetical protein
MNQELKQIQKQNNEAQYPQTIETIYPYSVRVEQTAKGARVSVHTYGKALENTIDEAIIAYGAVRQKLEQTGFRVASEE